MRKIFGIFMTAVLISVYASASTESHSHAFMQKFVTTRLAVTGDIKNNLNLSVDDLKKFPMQEINMQPLTCQSGRKLKGLGKIKGVLLKDILEKANIISKNHNDVKKMIIIASASDGYKVIYSWSEVFNSPIGDGAMIFIEQNNKPLTDKEGRIAMVSSRDKRTGARHVRWLQKLEVKKIID
ncbi:MAG: molybdopterin-dependent oxidoreductase [Bacteriovoracaceae bacterium]